MYTFKQYEVRFGANIRLKNCKISIKILRKRTFDRILFSNILKNLLHAKNEHAASLLNKTSFLTLKK